MLDGLPGDGCGLLGSRIGSSCIPAGKNQLEGAVIICIVPSSAIAVCHGDKQTLFGEGNHSVDVFTEQGGVNILDCRTILDMVTGK